MASLLAILGQCQCPIRPASCIPTFDEKLSYSGMMIEGGQIRAARGLLGWSRGKLAERARLSLNTIKAIENGITDPKASTLRKIEQVLAAAGIELIEAGHSGGPGVRLKR